MTGTLLHNRSLLKHSPEEVFFCPEESQFYSHCLERLVFHRCKESDVVVEFGCGDGSPVINSLLRAQFNGIIHGYELNASACNVAHDRIDKYDLGRKYIVHNQSFFDSHKPNATHLIANPPYLPAPDNDIYMPLLHGGIDGAHITNHLLTLNCPNVMVLVSSYSNPVGTIDCASKNGYAVADFMVTPLQFGYYSSEPKVKHWIAKLRQKRQAFYSNETYFLAGVLFTKKTLAKTDLSSELTQVVTALQ
ncbi:MAG: SAM-dependent methyltransferase [Stenomitos frigidus ULC029]